MAVWVTLRTGEVRKYNNGNHYSIANDFTTIAESEEYAKKSYTICKIRTVDIAIIEFYEPCEVTFATNAIEKSLDIILARARAITNWSTKGKLADLARLLRDFNPQRRAWKA